MKIWMKRVEHRLKIFFFLFIMYTPFPVIYLYLMLLMPPPMTVLTQGNQFVVRVIPRFSKPTIRILHIILVMYLQVVRPSTPYTPMPVPVQNLFPFHLPPRV